MTRDELADDARRLLLSGKYMNEFEATIAALEAAIPGLADVIDGTAVVVPREPTHLALCAMREAWLTTRRPGISGMTIEAQINADFARERAAHFALIAAATEK